MNNQYVRNIFINKSLLLLQNRNYLKLINILINMRANYKDLQINE